MALRNFEIMYYILLRALHAPMYHDGCLDRQFFKYTYMLGKVFQFGIKNVSLLCKSASIVVYM